MPPPFPDETARAWSHGSHPKFYSPERVSLKASIRSPHGCLSTKCLPHLKAEYSKARVAAADRAEFVECPQSIKL